MNVPRTGATAETRSRHPVADHAVGFADALASRGSQRISPGARFRRASLLAGLLVGLAMAMARSDVVTLRSGGRVHGRIVSADEQSRTAAAAPEQAVVTVETVAGVRVTIRKRDIAAITRRPWVVEEYHWKAATLPDTVDAHWRLAEWCREHDLRRERAEQLEAILKLDPQHRGARLGLGHRLRDGRWYTPEEFDAMMRSEGYVPYKGRYVTRQEFELLAQAKTEEKKRQEWFRKVRLWSGWLTGASNARRLAAVENFRELRDPDALPALVRFLAASPDVRLRRVFVQTVKRLPAEAVPALLVNVSLVDADRTTRSQALQAVLQLPPPARGIAEQGYIAALRHPSNAVVRRAAAALAELQSRTAIPALIEALITEHAYPVRVPGSDTPSYSFSPSGGFANPYAVPLPPEIDLALRAGQLPFGVYVQKQVFPGSPEAKTRVVTVVRSVKNPSVREALQKLTGQDYGYDEQAWRQWWLREKQVLAPQ
ncbi:MAG: hypothetical protein D6725_17570 [Planctomycetota bacterium]|nr:MAG: hypothetical protein D6725_17570 [Planctomycetota bacterium]